MTEKTGSAGPAAATAAEDGTTAANSPTSALPKPNKKSFFASLFSCCSGKSQGDDDVEGARIGVKKTGNRVAVPGTAGSDVTSLGTTLQNTQVILNEKSVSGLHHDLPLQPESRRRPLDNPRLDTVPSGPQIAITAPTPISPNEEIIHDRTPAQEQLDSEIESSDAGVSVPISAN
jgi:carboxy-terminal domain RNA polymerase II polypeptide A small phosphatase